MAQNEDFVVIASSCINGNNSTLFELNDSALLALRNRTDVFIITEIIFPDPTNSDNDSSLLKRILSTKDNNFSSQNPTQIDSDKIPTQSKLIMYKNSPRITESKKEVSIIFFHAMFGNYDDEEDMNAMLAGFCIFFSNRLLISDCEGWNVYLEKYASRFRNLSKSDEDVGLFEKVNVTLLRFGDTNKGSNCSANHTELISKSNFIQSIEGEDLAVYEALLKGDFQECFKTDIAQENSMLSFLTLDEQMADFPAVPSAIQNIADYFQSCLTTKINDDLMLLKAASSAGSTLNILSSYYFARANRMVENLVLGTESEFEMAHKSLVKDIMTAFNSSVKVGSCQHITSTKDELYRLMKDGFEDFLATHQKLHLKVVAIIQEGLTNFSNLVTESGNQLFFIPKSLQSTVRTNKAIAISNFSDALPISNEDATAAVTNEFEEKLELKANDILETNQKIFDIAMKKSDKLTSSLSESFKIDLENLTDGLLLSRNQMEDQVTEIRNKIADQFRISCSDWPQSTSKLKVEQLRQDMDKIYQDWQTDYIREQENLSAKKFEKISEFESSIKEQIFSLEKTIVEVDDIRMMQESLISNVILQYRTFLLEIAPVDSHTDFCHELTLKLKAEFSSTLDKVIQERQKIGKAINLSIKEAVKFYTKDMSRISDDDKIIDGNKIRQMHEFSKQNQVTSFISQYSEMSDQCQEIYLASLSASIDEKHSEIQQAAEVALQNFNEKLKKEVSEIVAIYDDNLASKFDEFQNLLDFEKCHEDEKTSAGNWLCNNNQATNVEILKLKLQALTEAINKSYCVAIDFFTNDLKARDALTKEVISEVRQDYGKEVEKHQQNSKFNNPWELEEVNAHAQKMIFSTLKRKKKLLPIQTKQIKEALDLTFKEHKREALKKFSDDPAIGIDLGTTYTCVSILQQDSVNIIPNPQGQPLIPSYVTYDGDGKVIKIGVDSKLSALEFNTTTVFDAKRMIGRKYEDTALQGCIKTWPFSVIKHNDVPKIEIGKHKINPEEVSAAVLQEMVRMTREHLGVSEVTKAVITVPAYFDDGQKQATVDAGKCAGLTVLAILTEPVAAAVAYRLDSYETPLRNVLVFDWGGGTLDVAILRITKGNIETLATTGDTHLGGQDVDQKMVDYCVAEFKKQTSFDLKAGIDSQFKMESDNAKRRIHRIGQVCEERKRCLSAFTCNEVEIFVPALITQDSKPIDLKIKITRETFNKINEEIFNRTLAFVDECMKNIHMEKDEIDDIIPVGGSSRILKIREMLSEYFDGKVLSHSVNPDEAVSHGAAIHAAVLNGQISQDNKMFSNIQDITPRSIGIEVDREGRFSVIIPRYTKVPKVLTENYCTLYDDQTVVRIAAYQGEKKLAKDNRYLGKFNLFGVPPAPAGKEKVNVTMEIDKLGILNVTAKCISTRGEGNMVIKAEKMRMTSKEIEEVKLKIQREVNPVKER